MSRIFISGSSTGLGLMAARLLTEQGHQVVLHARNADRATSALRRLPEASAIVDGVLSSVAGMREVAAQVNTLGVFDAVIHNAGVGYREHQPAVTEDGLPHVFAINTLAPYVLTALIARPRRDRSWSGDTAYAESKLHDALLAFAVARKWPAVFSNALEPGWVPTRHARS